MPAARARRDGGVICLQRPAQPDARPPWPRDRAQRMRESAMPLGHFGGRGHPLSGLSEPGVDGEAKMQGQTQRWRERETERGERKGGEKKVRRGENGRKWGWRGANSGSVPPPSPLSYQKRLSCDPSPQQRPGRLSARGSPRARWLPRFQMALKNSKRKNIPRYMKMIRNSNFRVHCFLGFFFFFFRREICRRVFSACRLAWPSKPEALPGPSQDMLSDPETGSARSRPQCQRSSPPPVS